jgi:uncharacterized protein YfeS
MSQEDEELWELSPENSHPTAARILTDEFYWDCVDEDSPFGNDNGADTLAFFREWREEHPMSDPVEFLNELLERWEATNDYWDVVEPAEVQKLLEEDEFGFSTRDDTVIAVAFGQLVLEGKIESEIKRRALLAIERQSLPAVSDGWREYAAERVERLKKMREALEQV